MSGILSQESVILCDTLSVILCDTLSVILSRVLKCLATTCITCNTTSCNNMHHMQHNLLQQHASHATDMHDMQHNLLQQHATQPLATTCITCNTTSCNNMHHMQQTCMTCNTTSCNNMQHNLLQQHASHATQPLAVHLSNIFLVLLVGSLDSFQLSLQLLNLRILQYPHTHSMNVNSGVPLC